MAPSPERRGFPLRHQESLEERSGPGKAGYSRLETLLSGYYGQFGEAGLVEGQAMGRRARADWVAIRTSGDTATLGVGAVRQVNAT
jgi:hypothetical protein